MKNKKIIITLSIIAILVLTIGVSFAVFTYNKVSTNNSNLIVGDIYMHYNETNQIQMENAMPTNPYIVNPIMASQEYTEGGTNELSKCVDSFANMGAQVEEAIYLCKGNNEDGFTLQQAYEQGYLDDMELTYTFIQENVLTFNSTIPYFEFTIDGKNTTTNKDIWYEVVLSKGDNLEGKTRIKDNLLKFRLVEIKDNEETIVVDNKSYGDLTSKRIWVNTINKNTTSEISVTYRLYMWISSDTNIGNTDDVDYTMEEWNNIFASIKVNVSGDFNEKYMKVDTNCFKAEENETGLTITDYNSSCGSKIAIPETIDNIKVTQIASNAFYDKNLVYINIPSSVVKIGAYAFMKNNITSINIPNTVTDLHCKSFDDGVVKNRDMTCVATNESCFTVGTINDGNEVAILDYDATCGTDVIIPNTIKGYPVTVIGNDFTNVIEQLSNKASNYKLDDLNNYQRNIVIQPVVQLPKGSFKNKNLTSIIIPDSVVTICSNAFYGNQLMSITIPNSVTSIEGHAFANNQLTSVTIGNGIRYIGSSAFYKYSFSNPNLFKITIDKSCSEIKNIQASSTDTTKYYPWLSSLNPYTTSGVTIYGSNNEVCDSY